MLPSSGGGSGFNGLFGPRVSRKRWGQGHKAFVIPISFSQETRGDRLDLESEEGLFHGGKGNTPTLPLLPTLCLSRAVSHGRLPTTRDLCPGWHRRHSVAHAHQALQTWLNREKYLGKASAAPAVCTLRPDEMRTAQWLCSAFAYKPTPHINQTRPDEAPPSDLPQKDSQYPGPKVPNRKATLNGCRWWPTINSQHFRAC